MLNVIILNVIMLNVIMLNVIMLNVVMLNVIYTEYCEQFLFRNVFMLNVIMLNVVASWLHVCQQTLAAKLSNFRLKSLTSMAFSLKLYCSLIDLMPSYQWNSTFLF
jgi:hypothetical protein